jgi:rhodanese-related sulfurtransferase
MLRTKRQRQTKKTVPIQIWGVAGLVLVTVVGYIAWRLLTSNTQSYPLEITTAQAAEKRAQGALILDVRQPSEWVQFHIPGATLIPLGELPTRLSEVPKDRDIVVVCRTGHRSAQGRDILRKAGYTRVTSMAGGVTKWQADGLPITTGE